MSEGERTELSIARAMARSAVDLLLPFCHRIEIAGSIRRGKKTIGDIEIVAIPHISVNLLGEVIYDSTPISYMLRDKGEIPTLDGPLHKQFKMHGRMMAPDGGEKLHTMQVDLYLTTPEQWGVILMIRTGDAEFSRLMVTPRSKGGMMPSYLQVDGGRVKRRGGREVFDTPEEEDVFKLWGIRYYEPGERGRPGQ